MFKMASSAWFEQAAYSLGKNCSIQLSYEDISLVDSFCSNQH